MNTCSKFRNGVLDTFVKDALVNLSVRKIFEFASTFDWPNRPQIINRPKSEQAQSGLPSSLISGGLAHMFEWLRSHQKTEITTTQHRVTARSEASSEALG